MRYRLQLAAACLLLPSSGGAAVLHVGPGQVYARPSAAIDAAAPGDTVSIAPGVYYDCAVLRAGRLTLVASAPGVVLTDATCDGKAALVVHADDIRISGLTFARMRVADGNGAGIRAEGGRLRVENSRFVDDEVGILVSSGAVSIDQCEFQRNGVAGPVPRGGDILAGPSSVLRVRRSRFSGERGRAALATTAARSEVAGSTFVQGDAAGAMLLVGAGSARILGNDVRLRGDGDAPFLHFEGGSGAEGRIVSGNTLVRDGGGGLLVRDWGDAPAIVRGNDVDAAGRAVSRDGYTLHRLRRLARSLLDAAGRVHRLLAGLLRPA